LTFSNSESLEVSFKEFLHTEQEFPFSLDTLRLMFFSESTVAVRDTILASIRGDWMHLGDSHKSHLTVIELFASRSNGLKRLQTVCLNHAVAKNAINLEEELHRLIHHNKGESIKVLIEHGANVNVKDPNGQLPLHRALEYNQSEVIELLLQNGAGIEAEDLVGNAKLGKSHQRPATAMGEKESLCPGHTVLSTSQRLMPSPPLRKKALLISIAYLQHGDPIIRTDYPSRDAGRLTSILRSRYSLQNSDQVKYGIQISSSITLSTT
jgi:hypothetical protein